MANPADLARHSCSIAGHASGLGRPSPVPNHSGSGHQRQACCEYGGNKDGEEDNQIVMVVDGCSEDGGGWQRQDPGKNNPDLKGREPGDANWLG